MTSYNLTRSNRKTIAIQIRNGVVEVRAPLRTPMQVIDNFVKLKEGWISERLAISSERAESRKYFTLTYGDLVTYRGKQYHITEKPGDRVGFDGESFYMPPGLSPRQVRAACIQIYRQLAERYITKRAFMLALIMSVLPSAVRINSAKARWGSCSVKQSVNFSWLLIMADDDVIDYVIVHELAHIKELNHSANFWAVVERVIPEYRELKARLSDLQNKLAGEDWSLK